MVYGPNSAVADPHREETTPTGWWWYVNANDESLPDFLLDNEARLVDIETYQDDAFIETRRMALVK